MDAGPDCTPSKERVATVVTNMLKSLLGTLAKHHCRTEAKDTEDIGETVEGVGIGARQAHRLTDRREGS